MQDFLSLVVFTVLFVALFLLTLGVFFFTMFIVFDNLHIYTCFYFCNLYNRIYVLFPT